LIAEVKSAPPIDPQKPVVLPGEVEFGRMTERKRDGVPLSRKTVDELRDLAARLQVDFPL
jgi:LDH2 family malate/lactate/ureidoglycolate dehydrogenase